MPALGNLSTPSPPSPSPSSSSVSLTGCATLKPPIAETTDSSECLGGDQSKDHSALKKVADRDHNLGIAVSSSSSECLVEDQTMDENGDQRLSLPAVEKVGVRGIKVSGRRRGILAGTKRRTITKSFESHVKDPVLKKAEAGVTSSERFLPFLVGAKKLADCLICRKFIDPEEELSCSVHGCKGVYHPLCVKEHLGISKFNKFKCPQHECFVCKQRSQWRCVRCPVATHGAHAPWPKEVIHLKSQPGRAVCWRHHTDWRLDNKHPVPASSIEDIFAQLPLPYTEEEFSLDPTWIDSVIEKEPPPPYVHMNKVEPPSYVHMNKEEPPPYVHMKKEEPPPYVHMKKEEPPPYVHIKRNIYLIKKKLDDTNHGVGCTNCSTTCSRDCVCRVQCISCSKACGCTEACTNRPFRKEKKIKIIKTELCGWGVEAAVTIKKEDFVIEYTGEVIDDALCEERLWDMKHREVNNFYMCEIRKNFIIDATFKGNASRFLNHSCDPNCVLEKWQVDGETRVGVFAARTIEPGESLTYDYRFVQFGPEVKCHCGAKECKGYLGTKKKIAKCLNICWGSKRFRTKL